jgi:hypothetical protein
LVKELTYEACALNGLTTIGAVVSASAIFPFVCKFDFTLDCCLGIPEVVKNVVEDIRGKIEDINRSYFVA